MLIDPTTPTRDINRRLLMAVHHGIPAVAMVSGGIIVVSGASMLVAFLGRYKIEK